MISCLIISGLLFLKSGLINLDNGNVDEKKIMELRIFSAKLINLMIDGEELELLTIQSSENQSLTDINKIKIYSCDNIYIDVAETDAAHFKMTGSYLGTEKGKKPSLETEREYDVLSVKTIIPKHWLIYDIGGAKFNLNVSLPKAYNRTLYVNTKSKIYGTDAFENLKIDFLYD